MLTNLALEDVIQAVNAFLNTQGYADGTLNSYRSGFNFFRNHFSTDEYSDQEAQLLVAEVRLLVDTGKLSERRFRMIRRIQYLMEMYVSTGELQRAGERPRCIQEPCGLLQAALREFLLRRETEGCSELTIRSEKSVVRTFLQYLEDKGINTLSAVEEDMIEVYLNVLRSTWPSGLSDPLCILRCFLKFCADTGLMKTDLSGLLSVRSSTKKRVKQGFGNDEIQRIIQAIDINTPLGKRNYAMITLAVHTGLRQIDVLNLKLQNIYWRESEIRITQHKTKRQLILPLDQETGDAIADYILNARPQSDSEFVFLRVVAPYRNLKVGSCIGSRMVQKYAAMCGVTWSTSERKGFHSFRRSLGREMLVNEVSLDTISEVLGHASRDSAKQYMSIDMEHLRDCALSLSGIECRKGMYQ
ncbi:MAG: tyrosine-type recombinase/integrase [Mogibacterium sp.]|nr:tyrosine-type recombinase/integrase [Mogibacterium sp.]